MIIREGGHEEEEDDDDDWVEPSKRGERRRRDRNSPRRCWLSSRLLLIYILSKTFSKICQSMFIVYMRNLWIRRWGSTLLGKVIDTFQTKEWPKVQGWWLAGTFSTSLTCSQFLLSMNDLFQDGQITPPQSYDQLGLDERRWHSVKVYRGSLMFIIKSSRQLLTTICGVVGSNKLCTRSIRCEVLQHQAHVMSFHATVRCPAHTDVQRREVRIT